MESSHQIVVVGGGLAGLIAAILLRREGIEVAVIERKSYPFHRVCGEYVSNEVKPFLKSINCFPHHLEPPHIDKFMLTSISGKSAQLDLDLGGFGLSRFSFDDFLFKEASAHGVKFLLNETVENITTSDKAFNTHLRSGKVLSSELVIGAFGKRSILDKSLSRSFMEKRSPYFAVKYHVKYDHPKDLIALHNFKGGYCGVSQVENGVVNMCYLGTASDLKKAGSIPRYEEKILFENPVLKKVLTHSEFLLDRPVTINDVSFAPKKPIEKNVLMAGDSAGLITPLCGNGMAMAIHAGKIAAESIIAFKKDIPGHIDLIHSQYAQAWGREFSKRLRIGRLVQRLFGARWVSKLAVSLVGNSGWAARQIVRSTHGETF